MPIRKPILKHQFREEPDFLRRIIIKRAWQDARHMIGSRKFLTQKTLQNATRAEITDPGMARVIQAACGEPKKALQNAAKAEAQNNFQAAGVIQAVCGEKMNALLNATKAEVNGYWATAGIIQAACGKPNKIHKIIALCWMY